MAKINVDIEYIKESLCAIGYEINDCKETDNNGTNWKLSFSNSGAIVTIYDTNKKGNTVVNGKLEPDEGKELKEIVESLKRREITIDPLNKTIVELINLRHEDFYYDYKQEFYNKEKMEDFLHDILCLSNNTENRDAYLIFGVTDNYEVIGLDKELKSNNIHDYLKNIKFAGGNAPEIEIKNLYYKHKRIGAIVFKSSKNIPFYLSERYKGICDHHIYTRVGDTNTPKDKHACYKDVEKLWRIHFERENE